MGILDTPIQTLVQTVLSVLGADATLQRTLQNYNPEDGTSVPRVTTYAVKCSPPEGYLVNEIDGTNVLRGDARVILASRDLSIVPSHATDVLLLGGVQFRIISVASIYAGDQAAAYTLQLRR